MIGGDAKRRPRFCGDCGVEIAVVRQPRRVTARIWRPEFEGKMESCADPAGFVASVEAFGGDLSTTLDGLSCPREAAGRVMLRLGGFCLLRIPFSNVVAGDRGGWCIALSGSRLTCLGDKQPIPNCIDAATAQLHNVFVQFRSTLDAFGLWAPFSDTFANLLGHVAHP